MHIHAHTHQECKHELKVCVECGNVYCTKCFKTWYKEQYTYTYGTTYVSAGTGDTPNITYTASHAHTP